MYDSPDATSVSNTAPEDERLSLVRRLIEIERDLERAEREREEIQEVRERVQVRIEKAREVRRQTVDQLASALGLIDGPAKAASPLLTGIDQMRGDYR